VGGQVTLLNTTVSKPNDCSYFVEVLGQQLTMVYGEDSVVMPNNRSVTLLGQHSSNFPLHNLTTGRTGVARPQHALSSALIFFPHMRLLVTFNQKKNQQYR
jgi:hypothetical protein